MKIKKENLNGFLAPSSIAIIGASLDEKKVGGILLKKALESKVEVIPINPKYEYLSGKKCYSNVLDYKNKLDLAIIAVPAEFVPSVLEDCGKKEIRNVIIISSGFSEAGNKKAEQELIDISKKYSIRFIGTNCFGICNPRLNLDLTFSASMPNKGDIAFISQSGALWSYISDFSLSTLPIIRLPKRGNVETEILQQGVTKSKGISVSLKEKLGFSSFVSLGNMDDLGFNEFIEYFYNEPKTKALVLYIEKLKEGRRFIEICRKFSKKKKIFAVKGGSSIIGMKAEFSHTASLASEYLVYKGAFKQAKVELCEGLLSAFEKASGKRIKREGSKPVKIGKKVFIITNAGGAGVLLSDYLSKKGFSIIDKPLDILGTAKAEDYLSAINSTREKDYNSLIVILTPQSMSEIKETAQEIANFQSSIGKKVIALFLGGDKIKESEAIFKKLGMPHFNTLEDARDSLEF